MHIRIRTLLLFATLFCMSSCSSDSPAAPKKDKEPSPTTTLQVDDPPRGGMVTAGAAGPSPITISGSACDPVSPIASLTVAGQTITLAGTSPCEDFDVELMSPWGFNLIEGSATNETGYANTLTHSFLRSPRYFDPWSAPKRAPAERASRAFYLQLNQAFVDDGNRNDLDDLASLMETALSIFDLNVLPTTIIGHPGTSTCDCVWPIPDITMENTGVRVLRNGAASSSPLSIDSVRLVDTLDDPNAVIVDLSIQNIDLPLKVTGYLSTCVTACTTRSWTVEDVYGRILVDTVSMQASVTAGALDSQGVPQFSVAGININSTNLRLDIDWGLLEFMGGALDGVANAILGYFDDRIELLLQDLVASEIPALLRDFFKSVELPTLITLPSPLDVELQVASQLDYLEIDTDVMYLGLGASVRPATSVHTSPQGPIFRGGATPAFTASNFALGIAPKDDLINQVFWAAWQGGALDIEDASEVGVSIADGVVLSASSSLPPVLMPGSGAYQIEIGLGDVFLEAKEGEQTTVSLYASGIIGADIGFDAESNHLLLLPEENPEFSLQFVKVPDGSDPAALSAQYEQLFQELALSVLSDLVSAIPVPSFPVGSLGIGGIPASLRWVVENGAIARQDPYYQLTGGVGVQ